MDFFYENRIDLLEDGMSIYENENFNFLAHWHTEVELVYVIEGEIYVGVNNNGCLLNAGDMVVCSSGDIHYYESVNFTSRILVLIFKPELVGLSANCSETLHFSSPFISKEEINTKGLSDIKNILYFIMEEKQKKAKYFDLLIKAKLIELCGLLLRYQDTYNLKRKPVSNLKSMQNILNYIENTYTNDISLEDVSKHFNINKYNLSRQINAVTGTSFKTYINSMKVTNAEDLILNTTKPLTEIALECGFNSIRTFNRVYKQLKGCVPSSVRRL